MMNSPDIHTVGMIIEILFFLTATACHTAAMNTFRCVCGGGGGGGGGGMSLGDWEHNID